MIIRTFLSKFPLLRKSKGVISVGAVIIYGLVVLGFV